LRFVSFFSHGCRKACLRQITIPLAACPSKAQNGRRKDFAPMPYVFNPEPIPALPVEGLDVHFPVRRIYCVGRNYAAHAREMGNDPDREPPFFFSKPAQSIVQSGATLPYPPETSELHFEGELVVALGKGGSDIAETDALSHVYGYASGNDLTRRDLQGVAKKMGRPWDMAKGFDNAAILGAIHRVAEVGHPDRGTIATFLNDEPRQTGDLADMIWSTPEIIAYLSRFVALAPGDLIMTGTPAGVGAMDRGDTCRVEIEGLSPTVFTYEKP
jgi:fumarylpyruvate hydrolase